MKGLAKRLTAIIVLTAVCLTMVVYSRTRPVELRLGFIAGSYWDAPNGNCYAVIDAAIERFEREHPNVHVTYTSGILKRDYSEWLIDQYLLGSEPDVFLVLPEDFGELCELGALAPLDGYLAQDEAVSDTDFYPAALQSGAENGVQYALPYECVPTLMCVNKTLLEITDDRESQPYRTVAISRDGETIIPRGSDQFKVGDNIYVIANQHAVKDVMVFSGKANIDIKNMMILGGSRIGARVAAELQDEVNIKLVDYTPEKAYKLAEQLEKTLIINEDGRNTEAMIEEGLSNMDAFVAVTGRAETNILAAMLAKRLGVKKVIAEVENLNFINLAESMGIDTIVNKKLITASNIFRFTMSTDVQAIKCLTGCDAEVLEFIVKPNSPATKVKIRDLNFPHDATIGGIVRGDRTFIAVGNTEINAYDRVVVFSLPSAISKIGKFFN